MRQRGGCGGLARQLTHVKADYTLCRYSGISFKEDPMVAIDAEQKNKLMHDLNLAIEDAQVLLRMTADQVGEEALAVRERVSARLGKAKEELQALQHSAVQSAKAAAHATDDFVHENPWKSVAIAAGAGLLLGVLISRR
jgi:ElaB/YqjD/DUF883 family membrane-anchored ribosome-binding protein